MDADRSRAGDGPRRVQAADARALACFFAALRAVGDDRWFHPHAFDDGTARQIAADKGQDYYAVEQSLDGEIFAYGMLRGFDQGYAVPSLGIAVLASARGTGASLRMMQHLHRRARELGAPAVRLKVYPSNQSACRLYRSLGYRFEEPPGADGQLLGRLDL